MDITKARTEAAAIYKDRQDEMDAHVRVEAVAFELLARVTQGDKGDRVLGALYGAMGDRTRPLVRVPEPQSVIRKARNKGVLLSVAAVQTDFEIACRSLIADAAEFWPDEFPVARHGVKQPGPAPHALARRGWLGNISEALRKHSAGEEFVAACYDMLGERPTRQDLELLPIFEFFRRCRNRVIHQDGAAGDDLAEFSRSEQLRTALRTKQLSDSMKRMTSGPPELESGELIVLAPSHAVLFLITARTLFNHIAARIRIRASEDGYLRMAACYGYVRPLVSARTHLKMPEQLGEKFLRSRYKVTDIERRDLIQRFKRLGLWEDIVRRFHILRQEHLGDGR